MKKTYLAISIFVISLISLSYIFASTHVYSDVKDRIVSVLCLSCIKMDPKTVLEFRFETVDGKDFPEFILENLSKGPVFLHFRIDVCSACDEMDPIIKEIFDVDDIKKPFLVKTKNFSGTGVTLIHINLDHVDGTFRNVYRSFDISKQGGVPMYTVITLGYDRGVVKPCYATGYSFLGKNSPVEAKGVLIKMIKNAVELYERNKEGY